MHFTAGLSALSLLVLPVLSAPAPTMAAISRAAKAIDTFSAFFDLIDGMPTKHDKWDFKNVPNACAVTMYTEGGGNCVVTVECAGDYKAVYTDFHVCYVGGEELLTDAAIGDFSVKWTGIEEQTMGFPELRMSSVDDGIAWDIHALTEEGKSKNSAAPARICIGTDEIDSFDDAPEGTKRGICIYKCGVPRL